MYNGQAGCGKLNCRSSKLSCRKEDLKWAFSQLRKRCRFIFRKSTRSFRLAPLKVYLANQNIRHIFCLIHILRVGVYVLPNYIDIITNIAIGQNPTTEKEIIESWAKTARPLLTICLIHTKKIMKKKIISYNNLVNLG